MLGRPTPDKHAEATSLIPCTPPFCASEWMTRHIVWSGAFISVLLHVGARKVSFFDAPRSPLIWQNCHPVVTSGEARFHSARTVRNTSPVQCTTTQLVTRNQPMVAVSRDIFFVLPAAPSRGKSTQLHIHRQSRLEMSKKTFTSQKDWGFFTL